LAGSEASVIKGIIADIPIVSMSDSSILISNNTSKKILSCLLVMALSFLILDNKYSTNLWGKFYQNPTFSMLQQLSVKSATKKLKVYSCQKLPVPTAI
jgi:hypothetical protein